MFKLYIACLQIGVPMNRGVCTRLDKGTRGVLLTLKLIHQSCTRKVTSIPLPKLI